MRVAFSVEGASAEGGQKSSNGTQTWNATPTTIPETPTKPDRKAPSEEPKRVPQHSPWEPAQDPNRCPQPGKEDLPFCAHTLTSNQVRRAD